MKLARVTTNYPAYLKTFYARQRGLAQKTFAEQKAAMDYDGFGWADFWSHALEPLGYRTLEIILNNEPCQRAWARENGLPDADAMELDEITFRQLQDFRPQIIWYDHNDEILIRRIREQVNSIRLVLGEVGSAIPDTRVWPELDLIVSCAPEAVERLTGAGLRTVHLYHAFEPRLLGRLRGTQKKIDCSFIGQIFRASQFHRHREQILEELLSLVDLQIFSLSADITRKEEVKDLARAVAFNAAQWGQRLGIPGAILRWLPGISRALQWPARPARPVNPKLKPRMKPGVYGLEMYETLRASKVSLNIHADSSPTHASNMRLFETTGVGTCLVTDWKENLPELFEPDQEVVIFRSAAECAEKVRWLLEHPRKREDIARAGQARTLKQHTFAQRAGELDRIIRGNV